MKRLNNKENKISNGVKRIWTVIGGIFGLAPLEVTRQRRGRTLLAGVLLLTGLGLVLVVLVGAADVIYQLTTNTGATTWEVRDSGGVVVVQIDSDGNTQCEGNLQSDGNLTVNGTGTSSIAGKLGIGTTEPGANLHVSGDIVWGEGNSNILTRDDITTRIPYSGFFQTPTGTTAEGWPEGDGSWYHLLNVQHSNDTNNYAMQLAADFHENQLWFRSTADSGTTGWSEVIMANPSGNVGIGTASPSYKLHVTGDTHGIYAEGSSMGGHFKDTDGTSYAKIGYGGYGVQAYGDSTGGYFKDTSTNIYCRVGYGTYSTYGNGTKSFVEDHPKDPTKEITYATLEGPEAGMYVRGSAKLKNGYAKIELPDHFSLIASEKVGVTVQVTPRDDCKGLYVVEADINGFEVKELQGGTSNAQFDWLVQGVRKKFEDFKVVHPRGPRPEERDEKRGIEK